MRIAEIREAIDQLNWSRRDATGGTPEENRRCNLPERLAPYIAKLEAIQIPARFSRDVQRRAESLRLSAVVIERWEANQLAEAE